MYSKLFCYDNKIFASGNYGHYNQVFKVFFGYKKNKIYYLWKRLQIHEKHGFHKKSPWCSSLFQIHLWLMQHNLGPILKNQWLQYQQGKMPKNTYSHTKIYYLLNQDVNWPLIPGSNLWCKKTIKRKKNLNKIMLQFLIFNFNLVFNSKFKK